MHVQHFLDVGLGRIDQHQRLLVAATIADRVELPVVSGEERRSDLSLVVRGDDRLELGLLVVAVKRDGVEARGTHCHAQATGVIGLPADDVAGILRDQRFLAGVEIDAIHVEHLGVAPVVDHEDVSRIIRQIVLDTRAHPGARRKVGDLAALKVDRDDVRVLVTTEVLFEQDGVAALPVIRADVARGFAGEPPRFADRLASVQRLHEHVEPAWIAVHRDGLHEAERLAVFAEPEVRLLRVAEEIADRKLLRCRVWRRKRESGRQRSRRG